MALRAEQARLRALRAEDLRALFPQCVLALSRRNMTGRASVTRMLSDEGPAAFVIVMRSQSR